MAAPRRHSQEDSSDSSNDEERERLKEAAWVPPVTGVKKAVQYQDSVAPITPSLRVRPDNHEHNGNELQTTPEFRAHVAKKLAAILDSCIKEIPGSSSLQEAKEENELEDEGFRLLSTSIPGDSGIVAPSTIPKRRVYSTSEDSEEENERRCREAAVSGLDILKHSALHPVSVQSSDSLTNDQTTKKHKKKKKKKDKGQNEGSNVYHQGTRQDNESRIDKELDNESQSNQKDLRQEHERNGFKKKKKKKKQFVIESSDH